MKGGHLEGDEVTDILFDGTQYMDFPGERIPTTAGGSRGYGG